MKTKIIVLILAISFSGCRTWNWGETLEYKIPKGKHQDIGMPMIIE